MQKRNHRRIPAYTVPGHAQIHTDEDESDQQMPCLRRAWWSLLVLIPLLIFLSGAKVQAAEAAADSMANAPVMTPSPGRVIAVVGRSFSGLSLYTLAGGTAGAAMAYPKDSEIQDWWRERRPP